MIQENDFKMPLATLLGEAFGALDTDSGFFMDNGQDGLLGVLSDIESDTASASLRPQNATIASHSAHVLYVIDLFLAHEQGEHPRADWEAAWRVRATTDAAWAQLRVDLRARYAEVMRRLNERTDWSGRAAGSWMMLLAHVAYHVGEIRQIRTSLD
jgi:uncharacterized damage-inducible protein DinB